MAEITLPIVLQILQTTGILVGIIYYIISLRNEKKSRDAQIFLQFSDRAGTQKWQNGMRYIRQLELLNYEDMVKDRENNPDEWSDIRYITYLLEDFGGLVRGGYLDISIIAYTSTGPIMLVWEKLSPTIEEYRAIYPRMWSEIEYLYDQLVLFKLRNPKLFE